MADEHHEHHDEEYHLKVDNKPHSWPKEFISGLQIKELAKVDVKTYSVWEVVPGPGDDIEIPDAKEVDLKGEPEKRFITGKKHSTEGGDGIPSDS